MVVSFATWIGWDGGGDAQWETLWTRMWPGLALGLIFVTVFAAATILAGRVFRLARPFVTRGEMLAEVKRSAAEAFLHGRVGRTANGTGMLVYVSLVERMVWIVGDDAVSEKVDDAVFEAARDRVLEGFREGRPAEGVADAIRGCGDALAAACPIGDDDVNEIRNDMIVLD